MCLRSKQLLSTLTIGLEVHHIIPVKDNGSGETENLMLVCSECHGVIHYRRRAFERYENRDRADVVLGEHIPMAEPTDFDA